MRTGQWMKYWGNEGVQEGLTRVFHVPKMILGKPTERMIKRFARSWWVSRLGPWWRSANTIKDSDSTETAIV